MPWLAPRAGIVRREPLLSGTRAEQIIRMPAPQPSAAPRRWTAAEVRALQDESHAAPRYELVDGELLVTPAPQPPHQRAVMELWAALKVYVDAERLGEVYVSPSDIELEAGKIVQPDVFVVPATGGALPQHWSEVSALLLAVEVLSPSTARQDRMRKRRFYQRTDVPEYWVVDLDARLFERWRPNDERAELFDASLAWHPADAVSAFTLDLAAFFARVHGAGAPE